jgi:hypothetical protein
MPFLSALTLMAQAFSALPAVPADDIAAAYGGRVACNPDPSKNRGCFRDFPGAPKAQAEAQSKTETKPVRRHIVACNPDPSKNRGCFRTLNTPTKAAVFAQAK